MSQICLFLAYSMIAVTSSLYADIPIPDIGRQEPSKNLYTFLTLLNGVYDNKEQIERDKRSGGSDRHLKVQNVFKPVVYRSLANKFAVYTQGTVNQTTFDFLWVFNEDQFGVIHAQDVSIVSLRNHDPFNKYDLDYSDIILGPFPRPGQCEALFFQIDSNVYVGSLPICVSNTSQEIGHYSWTLTCNAHSFDPSSPALPEKIGTLPYIFEKKLIFPLPSIMVNHREAKYKSSCSYN